MINFDTTFDGQRFILDGLVESSIIMEAGEDVKSLKFVLKYKGFCDAEAYIDFSEALNFPNIEMNTKYFYLVSDNKNNCAKLTCIIKYESNQLMDNEKIEGYLNIKVNRARNLVTNDIDFFAHRPNINPCFKLNMKLSIDRNINYTTEVIQSNSNPVYNEEVTFNIEMLRAVDC